MVKRFGALVLVLGLLAAGCTPAATTGQAGPGPQQRPAEKKRIVAAVFGLPFTYSTLLAVGGTGTAVPGTGEMEKLVNAGFTTPNAAGARVPRVVERVPTTENGLWRVLPDGRMELTFTLRQDVRWHDGTPFTVEDVLFTARVGQDRSLPIVRPQIYDFVERIDVRDVRTVVVYWKQPYIEADQIFATGGTFPIPKHLLESALANPDAFTSLPYWSREFVGVGPFRVKDWSEGSYAVVEANPQYFLGRPRVDEVEIKFIPAPTTMLANVLAGGVELTMGRGLSHELSQELQRQWRDGRIDPSPGGSLSLRPQHFNPDPPIIANVQYRQALYHAINRQEMVDSLMGGLTSVAHSPIPPEDQVFREAASKGVRYDYDPRRAAQLLDGLGLTRASDGLYRDASGQRISAEVRRAGDDDLEEKTILTATNYWRILGIDAEPIAVPPARQRDLEYRAKFPGFEISSSGSSVNDMRYIRASEIRTEANNYQGRNRTGYANPEFDALSDRYLVTIPLGERNQVLGQMIQHLTERVIIMYQFFETNPSAVANRLVAVDAKPREAPVTWNAHEWDVRN